MYSPLENGVVSEKHNIELGCKYFVGNVWIYFYGMIDVYVAVHWHTYIQLCLQLAMNRRLLWLKLWNMIVCIFLFEYRTLFRVLGSIVERSPTIWLWCSFMISPQGIGACFLLKEWGKTYFLKKHRKRVIRRLTNVLWPGPGFISPNPNTCYFW